MINYYDSFYRMSPIDNQLFCCVSCKGLALYVQGGYLIERGVTSDNYSEFMDVYEQASLIMSISDDTTAVVMMNFPNMAKNKIVRLIPYLSDIFKSDTKENIISYMPRKLPEHTDKLCFYLTNKLPPTWSLKPIQNLNETETASLLAKSSIFMSFSDQEGFGLPPLEAALSGAIVVGYTGQGGKEFFQSPNFQSVENGDFITFVSMVLNLIKAVESGALMEESFLKGREKLKIRYSIVEHERLLIEFAQRVGNFYR